VGEIKLSVDPNAIDKDRVQSWIDQLRSLPNAEAFLNVPKDLEITVTDNIKSLAPGENQRRASVPGVSCLAQEKPPMVWLAPNHWKDHVKTLVHEILHHKLKGLAGNVGIKDPHTPEFYKEVGKALRSLGIEPDPYEDLGVRPPPDRQGQLIDRTLKSSDPSAPFGASEISAANAAKAALKAGAHASAAAAAVDNRVKQRGSNTGDPGSNVPQPPGGHVSGSPNRSTGGWSGENHGPGDGSIFGGYWLRNLSLRLRRS
jgi:hypothetical protein